MAGAEQTAAGRVIDPLWAAPCGVCCRLCEFFDCPEGLSCQGCYKERLCRVGEPVCWFVTCVEQREIEHCGLCKDFPCQELLKNHETCAGDTPQIAASRINDLTVRARMGTVPWLRTKLSGTLPDVKWQTVPQGAGIQKERRRYARARGVWSVKVSFLPASQVFGLCNLIATCRNASPFGLELVTAESAREGLLSLARTHRTIEVTGEFPTSSAKKLFSGEVVWFDGEARTSDGVRIGIRIDSVVNGNA